MTDALDPEITVAPVLATPRPLAGIEFATKSEQAYAQLRDRIMAGELGPGTTINQELLAEELGLSVTPLREALRRLQVEGLVDVMSHRAVVVAPLRRTELDGLYQVRLQLDPFAAGLAAANASDAQRRALRSIAARAPAVTTHEQLRDNTEFHQLIFESSGNSVLAGICSLLWDRTNRYRFILLSDRSHDAEVWREHVEMAEAIGRRNPVEAQELVRQHTRSARALIEEAAAGLLT